MDKKKYSKRITENNITELEGNQVFVFGSNEGGHHGAGAAKTARKWGAKMGKPEGLMGQTYAIPTKKRNYKYTLSLSKIQKYVDKFIDLAKIRVDLVFLVTEIGCGLAYLNPKDIAPMFKKAIELENIHLPKKFWKILLEN